VIDSVSSAPPCFPPFKSPFATPLLSSLCDGDLSVRRSRVNDEFSPAAGRRGIPRAKKFYDPLAGAARLWRAVSEIAWCGLENTKRR